MHKKGIVYLAIFPTLIPYFMYSYTTFLCAVCMMWAISSDYV